VSSIDIDRDENVVVVKGSVEAGQKAKEEIVELLSKLNINISKLRYITPAERKEAALKLEAQRAAEQKKLVSLEKSKKAEQGVGSRDDYLALLNKPGIGKSTIRRIRRKLREDEQVVCDGQEETKDSKEIVDRSENVMGSSDNNDEPLRLESPLNDPPKGNVKKESPSSVVAPTYSFDKSSSVGELERNGNSSHETVGCNIQPPPPTTVPKKPVVIPQGAAGNLLSMILGTTPVTNSANRICSPRSMSSGGRHGAIGSISRVAAVGQTTSSTANRPQSRNVNEAVGDSGTTYYKSKTGRAIRLD
jgi:hypothetical protein